LNDFISPTQPAIETIGGQPVPEPRGARSVWHYVYTLAVVAAMVFMSFAGAHQQGQFAQKRGHVLFYVLTIGTEVVLLGIAYLGMRLSRMKLRDVIGGRWNSFEAFRVDVGIAFLFWIVSYLVLIGLALAMHQINPGAVDEGKKTIQLLAPHGALELLLWISMSVVAGFVEEIVFRGYFQLQFASLLRNVWAGMFVSAAIFGLSHAYEGRQRMLLIFVYGAMFGTLAILRRSLRPGMMAHAWHDSFEGIILVIADKLVKSGAIK
jgi:uncharacterized protein